MNEYNFNFISKFGELRGSSYTKGYDNPSVDDIIDEFVTHCACIGFDVKMCRLIKCIGLYEDEVYDISDCLKHYIDSITRRERYGISNDAILVKVCYPYKHFVEQLDIVGFVPIDFIGNDPDIKYYAHKNDFIIAINNKGDNNCDNQI